MAYILTNTYMGERNEEFDSPTEAYAAYDSAPGMGWNVKDEEDQIVYRESELTDEGVRYYTVDEDGSERTVAV